MGKKHTLVAAAGFTVALATMGMSAPADAAGWLAPRPPAQSGGGHVQRGGGHHVQAPEIDATSGVQAIALLSGILLLVGERARRRRR